MDQENVSATLTVAVPAARVFAVLADPAAHAAIDGTGWVQEAVDRAPLTEVGQIFRMDMYHPGHPDGDYRVANKVQVLDPPRAIGWLTGTETAGGELELGGWLWHYDLAPLGPSETEVTLTYDWSAVPQFRREYIRFPPFGPEHLANSLHHLADLAVGPEAACLPSCYKRTFSAGSWLAVRYVLPVAWHFLADRANRTGFRRRLTASASGLLVFAIVGCGFTGHTAAGPATTAPPAPQHTTNHSGPSPSAPDGARLYSLLLPASAMPAGFRIDPSGTQNGAQAFPQDVSQPVPKTRVCNRLDGTGWIGAGGIATADFAQNDYWNASRTAEVAQEIDAFQAGDAKKVMSRLWQVFGYCRTFALQANGATTAASLTRARLAGVGNQAIGAVWTTPAFYGGTSLVAIRIGDAIATVLVSSPGGDKGAAAAVAMAKRVAERVHAVQQAG